MGMTTNSLKKNRIPVEPMPDNPKRLFMTKAEVIAEEAALAAKKAKIEAFKRKLEQEEVSESGVRNEESEKGQEVKEVTDSAKGGLVASEISDKPTIDNPLVKRRGRKPKA